MAFPKQTAAVPRVDPRAKFFLLHGDDEAAIEMFKTQIVDAHLTQAQREENYREIVPTGGANQLRRVLGEVQSELATVSFLPDVKRVVTLYGSSDFYEARTAKARAAAGKAAAAKLPPKTTASERLAEFVTKHLPQLPAVLIVVAVEDYEKWKKVVPANPVVTAARDMGTLFAFKQTGPQFAFFDALFARKTGDSIQLWRDWLQRNPASPKPYVQLAAQLRLLIQAKTASSDQLKARGISREQFRKDLLPDEPDRNYFALRPEWRQEKLARFAANFTFAELLGAYEKLQTIQKYAIPQSTDLYVPDKSLLAELWITDFTARKR